MRCVFVTGPPRSGTTLLLDLLRLHQDVDAHGESFHHYHHNLLLFRHWPHDVEHFRLSTAEANPTLTAAYRHEIEKTLARSGRPVFALKISTLSLQVDYVRALVPEARFVQIVRDGRDCACSMEDLRQHLARTQGHERELGPAPDPLGVWCVENDALPHLRGLASWFYHVSRSWLDLRFCGAQNVLRVRYEDLIAAPESTLERVLGFVGVEADPAVTSRLSDIQDAPGSEDTLGFSTTQATGAVRVGRYQHDLPHAARTAAAPLLALPMRLLGYQPDPEPDARSFTEAARACGLDAAAWRDKVAEETDWFERHHVAFAPERLLSEPDTPTPQSKPLLVDGALVGNEQRAMDGTIGYGLSFVQKQDRRHTFADAELLWPQLAPLLNGKTSAGALQHRFGERVFELLTTLHGLGFVAYVE